MFSRKYPGRTAVRGTCAFTKRADGSDRPNALFVLCADGRKDNRMRQPGDFGCGDYCLSTFDAVANKVIIRKIRR